MSLDFDKNFSPNYNMAVKITDKIQILTANNPSAYTFHGTNSYIIGQKQLMILDPGPNLEDHFQNLVTAVNDRPVSHILLTHSHDDHSQLAKRASAFFNAPIAKAPLIQKINDHHLLVNGESATLDVAFDIAILDNMILANNDFELRAISTPGHASDHMAFAFEREDTLFSGDHVMAWATTVIIPPDGSMQDYMASLEKLSSRAESHYLAGHGGMVSNPQQLLRGLRSHRKIRERAILERLHNGDRTISEIIASIYRDIDPNLKNAAALSVWAHLIDLYERNLIACETMPTIDGNYSSL